MKYRVLLVIVGALLLAMQLATGPIQASTPPTYTVNSTADVPADPGDTDYSVCRTAADNTICTLRAAIDKANKYPGGGVTIRVPALSPPGKYGLSAGSLVI